MRQPMMLNGQFVAGVGIYGEECSAAKENALSNPELVAESIVAHFGTGSASRVAELIRRYKHQPIETISEFRFDVNQQSGNVRVKMIPALPMPDPRY